LKHRYIITNLTIENSDKLKIASEFLDQVIALLEQSKQLQTMGVIPKEDIDQALDLIFKTTVDGSEIRASSVKKIYRVVAQRILTTPPVLNGPFVDDRSFVGLEKKHLAGLRREFKIWQMNQAFIDSMDWKQARSGLKLTALIESTKSFFKLYVDRVLKNDNLLEQAALGSAFEDFRQLMQQDRVVNFNSRGRLVITKIK